MTTVEETRSQRQARFRSRARLVRNILVAAALPLLAAGYLLGGEDGALLALYTVLTGFLAVGATLWLVPRLREWTGFVERDELQQQLDAEAADATLAIVYLVGFCYVLGGGVGNILWDWHWPGVTAVSYVGVGLFVLRWAVTRLLRREL